MQHLLLHLIALASLVLLVACEDSVRVTAYSDDVPRLVPDYADVTVPVNIAPLSFGVEGLEQAALILAGQRDSLTLVTRNGCFNPPARAWHRLLEAERGHTLRLTVCRPVDGGWEAMRAVSLTVSADSIDPYLVYRRVTPGYGLWNRMGLYQRCLENYDEMALYENRYGRGNCVNCHSFCDGNPDRWQVHVRYRQAGTYVMDGLQQTKLQLQDPSLGKPVYANWHPDGRHVAYSTNSTFFLIHTSKVNRWEVMDDRSDVMVTDVETGQCYRSPLTAGEGTLETWPCFSPDGRWLYFCTAPLPSANDLPAEADDSQRVIAHYDSVCYSLCRIAFDAASCTFGTTVDTLYNARTEGGSASLPRLSPDGRWLCFTRAAYGNFSICHRDADLCLLDVAAFDSSLETLEPLDHLESLEPLKILNDSTHVDSWHSWSRNSRWLVFSSKRDDGIYTRPYFTHIGADGQPSKPFVLPQHNAPSIYDLQMDCYNLPELVTGPVRAHLKPTGQDSSGQGSGVN